MHDTLTNFCILIMEVLVREPVLFLGDECRRVWRK